jgi:hypothetical protein
MSSKTMLYLRAKSTAVLFGQYKTMKGFIGVTAIFAVIGLLTLFGGAFFDLTTTGARCALGVVGTGNFTCDELGHVAGSTVILPDRNVRLGVESINQLRSIDLDAVKESGVLDDASLKGLDSLYESKESGFRLQIILGLGGIIIILLIPMIIFYKFTPGSKIDAGSLGMCVLGGILLVSFVHLAFTGLVEGQPEMPFTGVATLVMNQNVMWDVVDDTALLPGTLTSDDIIQGES